MFEVFEVLLVLLVVLWEDLLELLLVVSLVVVVVVVFVVALVWFWLLVSSVDSFSSISGFTSSVSIFVSASEFESWISVMFSIWFSSVCSNLSSEIVVAISVFIELGVFFVESPVKTKVPTTTPFKISNAVVSDMPPKFLIAYSLILSETFKTFFLNESKSNENSYSEGYSTYIIIWLIPIYIFNIMIYFQVNHLKICCVKKK